MSDDVQGALREMAEKIGALSSSVSSLTSTWQQQEAKASDGRRDLHNKVDALRSEVSNKVAGLEKQVTELGAKVATAIDDIADMKPSVEAFNDVKQQAAGARWLGKLLWGAAVFASGGVVWIITNIVDIHFKTPPVGLK
ncbi:hypothetical protein SAMN05216337_1001152 [Bradyrhizobium brasilense]|uniref:DUF1515 domain-containing protein n=1 Tax=Bradyrhizobium brasilense TaxID=1419277 RepID=A0A1G6IHJ8_9BRAD|nr:hypothetical protein [Bradyrhizobium brasilense]SDC06007.1 hypothetical protein SAMN05216337_1001152 [Bradyrhizobium brasilense]